jgi:hypothetical protein
VRWSVSCLLEAAAAALALVLAGSSRSSLIADERKEVSMTEETTLLDGDRAVARGVAGGATASLRRCVSPR